MKKLASLFSLETFDESKIDDFFADIAEELFKHYCIKLGNVTYSFLEIECYYWSEHHQDNRKDGKPFVYERINERPCSFISHSSGMDLCFKSSDKQYGGILIRALKRTEGDDETILPGPWDCHDALINYSDGVTFDSSLEEVLKAFPILLYNNEADTNVDIKKAIRCGVPDDSNYKDALYCFYNAKCITEDGKWGMKDPWKRFNPRTKKVEKNTYTKVPWKRLIRQ